MRSGDAIDTLRAAGWFDELPAAAAQATTARVLSCSEFDCGLLATVILDAEDCVDPEDYAAVMQQFARQLADVLSIRRVVAARDGERAIAIRFEAEGRSFSRNVVSDDTWMSFEVVDAINDALADCGLPLALQPLPVPDSRVHLALAAPEAFERAVSLGIIPSELPE